MAQQDGGWPLGLQPLNLRGGENRSYDLSHGSMSFSTFISASPNSSTDSSSDLDTESTASFFQDRSITLGRLIGITTILDLSSGPLRSRRQVTTKIKKSQQRVWTCLFLCSKANTDEEAARSTPSLGEFLEVERRASSSCARNHNSVTYELDGLPGTNQAFEESNSLFSNGCIAPPPSGPIGSSIVAVKETRNQVCCW